MRTFLYIAVLLLAVLLIAYWLRQKESIAPKQATTEVTIGHRTKEYDCQVNGPFQDKACTPGAVFTDVTADQVCVRGYAKSVRNVPVAEKHEVYRGYGITHHTPGEYEVDHLISLELGGSNEISNLWPEAAEPRPGFHEKDKVENYLHEQVCSGRMALADAQRKIANNWLEIYQTFSN